MNKENKISINNLIYALLFLTFGIILLTSTEDLISIASKVIGIAIIIAGVVKTFIYVYRKCQLFVHQNDKTRVLCQFLVFDGKFTN